MARHWPVHVSIRVLVGVRVKARVRVRVKVCVLMLCSDAQNPEHLQCEDTQHLFQG